MKGQIHRALIELVTNADDAYGGNAGDIHVSITKGAAPYAHVVSVLDLALGLNAADMENFFTKVGGKNAAIHHGGDSRGLLGRGAKDVAIFGKVHFQAIKDGLYSDLELNNQGHTSIEHEDLPATPAHYAALNIPEGKNGLKATIYVDESGSTLPKATDLLQTLKNHAQLRDLIKRRIVTLSDFRKPEAAGQLISDLPTGTPIGSYELVLDGYDATATLTLNKLDELQASAVGETSPHGLLIVSGKTIFQNTWFSFDLPETRRVAGRVDAPIIMDVIKAENRSTGILAESILSITRDGLNKNHPLVKAISKAVKLTAHPILTELAKETGKNQSQGEKLTKDLAVAAEAIKADVLSMIRELDDEAPLPDTGDEVGELEVIPAVFTLKPSSKGTFSVRVSEALTTHKVIVTTQDARLKPVMGELNKAYEAVWKPHERLAKMVSQWQFTAPNEVGIYDVSFEVGAHKATAKVVVRIPQIGDPTPPDRLEFKPAKVTASPGRGKNLLLRAPISYAREEIVVTTSGSDVTSAPSKVILRETTSGSWVEAIVHVKTGLTPGIVHIQALALNGEVANAELKVSEAGASGGGPKFDFKLSGEPGITRFSVDQNEGNFVVEVYGQHKSFNNVFGPYSVSERKFSNEDEPVARAVLAETLANAFAQQLIEFAFDKRPQDGWDPSKVLAEHRKYVEKLALPLTKALVK
jgi:hypothetical protein